MRHNMADAVFQWSNVPLTVYSAAFLSAEDGGLLWIKNIL